MSGSEEVENKGVDRRNKLRREWDDRPIHTWVGQDSDPDEMAMQPTVERLRTPR